MTGAATWAARARCITAQAADRTPWRRLRHGIAITRQQVGDYAQEWAISNARAHPSDILTWVVLGDSSGQGIGASAPDRGYVGVLRTWLQERDQQPWRVVNLSVSGARIADVVAHQVPALYRFSRPPDLVTCAVGVNDLTRRPRVGLRADLCTLLRALPPGTAVATLPQGVAQWRARRQNTTIREAAAVTDLVVADVWATTGPPWRGNYAADFFHPSDQGYAHWARAFRDVLEVAPPQQGRVSGAQPAR